LCRIADDGYISISIAASRQQYCIHKQEVLLLFRSTGFRTLGAVFGAGLHPLRDALRIQSSANDVVTDAREVFDTAASDKDDAVLLKVVSDTGDVAGGFNPVAEADPRDLAKRGVRLFGRRGTDGRADASLLRAVLIDHRLLFGVPSAKKRRGGGLGFQNLSSMTNELAKSWHEFLPFF